MATYNLTKPEDREQLRSDRQSELDAITLGAWPRDINDFMRWSPPRNVEPSVWAARMCRADLDYLQRAASVEL